MRSVAALALLMLVGGCSFGMPARQAGPAAPMPECTGELAFFGETSLGALGLGQFAGPDSGRVGMIWVTANPVAVDAPAPVPPLGGAVPAPMPATRWVCVQWPDGSGMAGPIEDDWQPPSGVLGAPPPASSFPLGVVVLVAGAVILIGVSFFAFRREPAA